MYAGLLSTHLTEESAAAAYIQNLATLEYFRCIDRRVHIVFQCHFCLARINEPKA